MADTTASKDFIREIIDEDLRTGRHDHVVTRFPPEPNGYLHIGHAKSICLNFGIAKDYGGRCNLRFDDTNPVKEEQEYVDAITRDVEWLGFEVGDGPLFASDYFERMYELAEHLIRRGLAYVDDQSEDEIRAARGTLTEPGTASPYRDRSVAANLDLFRRMRAGEFADGAKVLRAKIDMAAANMKMRDPLLYRIKKAHHHNTGDAWCIYPFYDYAHPLEDAFEGITHSICTLEFQDNRDIYDWVIRETEVECVPRQYEFARLALDYTVMSKRKLLQLVAEGHVSGWDDPRMPTIAAMRRRGYTPEALRKFCELIGVAKNQSTVDIGKLEYAVRDDLNYRAPRVMCVLAPLKVVLTNVAAGETRSLTAPYFPVDIGKPGERAVPLSRELYIERDDFAEDPPKGYRRLAPGRTVRLRHGPCITCDEVVRGADGAVAELRCRAWLATIDGTGPESEQVAGVIHWVDATTSLPVEIRLYDRLFNVPQPDAGGEFLAHLNPSSLTVIAGARVEPSVAHDDPETRYQFERQGYFVRDGADSRPGELVFNRIVTLRDSWGKAQAVEPEAASEPAKQKSPRAATRPARRSKADYRAEARNRNPVLAERMARYASELGLDAESADLLTAEVGVGDVFEAALAVHGDASGVAKWVINELPRALGERDPAAVPSLGARLGALVALVEDGAISATAGREVLELMLGDERGPRAIVDERGLAQVSDDAALAPIIDRVLAANAGKVEEYKAGKTGLLGFFVGQVMQASGGKADPKRVKALVAARLPS
jgi:glutaminyl-tRNA synthetase